MQLAAEGEHEEAAGVSWGAHLQKMLVGVLPLLRALLAGESMTHSVVVVLQLPMLLPVHQKQACQPSTCQRASTCTCDRCRCGCHFRHGKRPHCSLPAS